LKNSTRNRNFKSKRTHSICAGTSYLSNDTKKHTTKSRETITLSQDIYQYNSSKSKNFSGSQHSLNYDD
jgi:hypothetical protein